MQAAADEMERRKNEPLFARQSPVQMVRHPIGNTINEVRPYR
jgi:hypothetical protein